MRTVEGMAIGRLLSWAATITTVTVLPWNTYDPINVPKLTVLSISGFMVMAFLATQGNIIFSKEFRPLTLVAFAFIADLFLVLIFSGTNTNQEFFGTNGRSTGFLAFVSLTFLLMAGALSSTGIVCKKFSWFLIGSGVVSALYGVAQALDMDPANWINNYSPAIGFLGNPDFQSSFMGFSAVLAFALLLSKETLIAVKTGLLAMILVAMYVIKETGAQQGFLVLLGGSAMIALIFVYQSKAKALTLPIFSLGFVSFALAVMGSLNSGPLASLLHKPSVIYRGDYWRAGWKMTLDNPYFGVGLDSYGDWYRRSRDVAATLRRGPDITSNAAHNVFLDFSSNGGFPLLIIYLALMILVARAAVRVIRRSTRFDPVFTGLFAVWMAYQAQSIISLNQLGLAVWGWIISGLLIGYEINTRLEIAESKAHKLTKKDRSISASADKKVLPVTSVALSIGFLVGLLVGLPPLIASSKVKSAFESGDKFVIAAAVDFFPQDLARTNQIAYIFKQNDLETDAISLIMATVKQYPDSYDSWALLASLKSASSAQIAQARAQMKRLDPHNPDLQ